MLHIQVPIFLCILRQQLPTIFTKVCILLFWSNVSFFSHSRSINDAHTVSMDGGKPIRPVNAMMKANDSALLIGLCTSSSGIVPRIPYHGPSSLTLSSFTTLEQIQRPVLTLHSTSHQLHCVREILVHFCPNPAKCQRFNVASKACCFPLFAELWVSHQSHLAFPIFVC